MAPNLPQLIKHPSNTVCVHTHFLVAHLANRTHLVHFLQKQDSQALGEHSFLASTVALPISRLQGPQHILPDFPDTLPPEREKKPLQDPSRPWNLHRVSSGRGAGDLSVSSTNRKSLRPPKVAKHPGPELQRKAHLQEASWGHPHILDRLILTARGGGGDKTGCRLGVREPQGGGRRLRSESDRTGLRPHLHHRVYFDKPLHLTGNLPHL